MVSARRGTVHDAGELLLLQMLRAGRAGGAPGLAGDGQHAALRVGASSLAGARSVSRAPRHHRGGRRGRPLAHPLGAREPQAPERG